MNSYTLSGDTARRMMRMLRWWEQHPHGGPDGSIELPGARNKQLLKATGGIKGSSGGRLFYNAAVVQWNAATGQWVEQDDSCGLANTSDFPLVTDTIYMGVQTGDLPLASRGGTAPAFMTSLGCCDGGVEPPPGGCCPSIECEPICITIDDLTIYHGGTGATLYTFGSPVELTHYITSPTADGVHQYPWFKRVFLESVSASVRIHVSLHSIISCSQDTVLTHHLVLLVAYDSNGPSFGAPRYGLWNPSGNETVTCDITELEMTDTITTPLPGANDIGLSFDVTVAVGACGVAGEQCYEFDCTGSLPQQQWCCDSGTSWFASPTEPPEELTGTVTAATACSPYTVGSTLTVRRVPFGNDAAVVRNEILPVYGSSGLETIVGVTCGGDWYSSRGYTNLFTVLSTDHLAGTVTNVFSTSPVDFEVTFTAHPLLVDLPCTSLVVRFTE
jgi:hypothetical protein